MGNGSEVSRKRRRSINIRNHYRVFHSCFVSPNVIINIIIVIVIATIAHFLSLCQLGWRFQGKKLGS